jgi:hypothetical protein
MKRKKGSSGSDKVGEVTTRFEQAAKDLRAAKKWTIADFLRLFLALLIPAGMIFAQYYFWAQINEFARENIQLLIVLMELVIGLVFWYGLYKVFAIRAGRIKLPKAGYDVLARQINTEQKIKLLEEKATKWELSDLFKILISLIVIGVLVALLVDNFTLPYFPEYTTLVIPIIGLGVFIWLILGFRKEKKEVCAQQITALKQYL